MHIWLVLALSVCSVFIAGGQSADTPTLTPGIAVEGALSGAQSHAYQIALDAGQFVAVAIRRTLNYPIVTFADPSGRKILEDPQADTVLIAQLMGVRQPAQYAHSRTHRTARISPTNPAHSSRAWQVVARGVQRQSALPAPLARPPAQA